jgi:hypothetical protein
MGVPLRADPLALKMMQRRSFNRAVASMAMTVTRGMTSADRQPQEILREHWRDDDDAGKILRAAQSPLTTSGFAAIQSTRVLPQLAPDAASSKLLGMGNQFDLTGINSFKLPWIGYTGRPANPMFVAEGQPAPAPNLATSAAILGPVCRVMILCGVSGELQSGSAETAEHVISEALAISVEQSQDALLFSNTAAVPGTSPAGLLNGLTPLTSTGTAGGGAAAVADDLGALAGTISHHGIGIDDLIFVTTAAIATKIRTLAGPFFQDVVLSSAAIPDGEIIAIVPQGLATGYSGEVQVETSIAATLHFESATPLPIGVSGDAKHRGGADTFRLPGISDPRQDSWADGLGGPTERRVLHDGGGVVTLEEAMAISERRLDNPSPARTRSQPGGPPSHGQSLLERHTALIRHRHRKSTLPP